MKIVDCIEYGTEKRAFMEKHDYDYRVETSSMDEYGRYHKEYIFQDGAIWYEQMSPVTETATIELHKCTIPVEVKFFRTEYWTNEDSESRYLYEKF